MTSRIVLMIPRIGIALITPIAIKVVVAVVVTSVDVVVVVISVVVVAVVVIVVVVIPISLKVSRVLLEMSGFLIRLRSGVGRMFDKFLEVWLPLAQQGQALLVISLFPK